jgi:ADP-ribose pyrophosphatase
VEQVARKLNPHTQARGEANTHYKGKRVKMGDYPVSWANNAPSYRPIEFTHDKIVLNQGVAQGWADPPTPHEVADLAQRKTYEGPIDFVAGVPRNPRGRTGLCGRGLLGRWGPNHAADPIVTRYNPQTGKLQLVAMRREDTGQFAVPGGMSKTPGDMWNDRMRSEFETEVAQDKDDEPLQKQHMKMLLDDLFQGKDSSVVYRGCE